MMSNQGKRPSSHLTRALLAAAVLYFAMDLNAGDRGVVDYAVICLVVVAVLWNLVHLGRLLYADGGGRALWNEGRTVLFWVVGLMNTVWSRDPSVGNWKFLLGGAILVAAIVDTYVLYRMERAALARLAASATDRTPTSPPPPPPA